MGKNCQKTKLSKLKAGGCSGGTNKLQLDDWLGFLSMTNDDDSYDNEDGDDDDDVDDDDDDDSNAQMVLLKGGYRKIFLFFHRSHWT